MAKYKLVNNLTHSIIYTNHEEKKNQLLEEGFHIQNPESDKGTTQTTKKRKAAVKNGKNKAKAEGNI